LSNYHHFKLLLRKVSGDVLQSNGEKCHRDTFKMNGSVHIIFDPKLTMIVPELLDIYLGSDFLPCASVLDNYLSDATSAHLMRLQTPSCSKGNSFICKTYRYIIRRNV